MWFLCARCAHVYPVPSPPETLQPASHYIPICPRAAVLLTLASSLFRNCALFLPFILSIGAGSSPRWQRGRHCSPYTHLIGLQYFLLATPSFIVTRRYRLGTFFLIRHTLVRLDKIVRPSCVSVLPCVTRATPRRTPSSARCRSGSKDILPIRAANNTSPKNTTPQTYSYRGGG